MGPTTLERHFVLWFKLATGGDKSGHKAPRFLAGAVVKHLDKNYGNRKN